MKKYNDLINTKRLVFNKVEFGDKITEPQTNKETATATGKESKKEGVIDNAQEKTQTLKTETQEEKMAEVQKLVEEKKYGEAFKKSFPLFIILFFRKVLSEMTKDNPQLAAMVEKTLGIFNIKRKIGETSKPKLVAEVLGFSEMTNSIRKQKINESSADWKEFISKVGTADGLSAKTKKKLEKAEKSKNYKGLSKNKELIIYYTEFAIGKLNTSSSANFNALNEKDQVKVVKEFLRNGKAAAVRMAETMPKSQAPVVADKANDKKEKAA